MTFELGRIHSTAVVADTAVLGAEVTIGAYTVIHPEVEIADRAVIGSHCVIGEPTAEFYDAGECSSGPCVVGAGAVIRSHSVVYRDVTIGDDFQSGHRVTIREGSKIGTGVRVGTASDLQGDLAIGDYVRLHSNVHVGRLSVIEDFCWIYPAVVITNDPHPPSDSCTVGGTIRKFAIVATHSVLMPGVEIGEQALVGAMSLVTRDVPPSTVVVGSPAKAAGLVTDIRCQHGNLEHVYPWPDQFRRGYPDGVLPEPGTLA